MSTANIFSLGDCSSVPTSKTAAAVAAESRVLKRNLLEVVKGGSPRLEVSPCNSVAIAPWETKIILRGRTYSVRPFLEDVELEQTPPTVSIDDHD